MPMPNHKKKTVPTPPKKQREIVLSPLFELKDPRYKVKYAKMSEAEMRGAARHLAEIVLDAVEKKLGKLPPPPSEKEFHRLWNKLAKEKDMDVQKRNSKPSSC